MNRAGPSFYSSEWPLCVVTVVPPKQSSALFERARFLNELKYIFLPPDGVKVSNQCVKADKQAAEALLTEYVIIVMSRLVIRNSHLQANKLTTDKS